MQILPGAIGHAPTAAIAAELFSGSPGLGRLVIRSILSLDAELAFATVAILSSLRLLVSLVGHLLSKRHLHWFGKAS
jgi:ABC-type nitrate/sulfonate/bicarbonate transport system permease component